MLTNAQYAALLRKTLENMSPEAPAHLRVELRGWIRELEQADDWKGESPWSPAAEGFIMGQGDD